MNLKQCIGIMGAAIALASPRAWCALPDEIQVYDDSINKAGEWGLELHLNSTPSGQLSDYPGEVGSMHGQRSTLEVSYGLTPSWEAGLYLPVVRRADGETQFAGPSFRMKWIPHPAPEGGFFYGLNSEITAFKAQYAEEQNSLSLQPILGYRTDKWLFITNPIVEYSLRAGYRQGGPEFTPSFKLSRSVAEGFASGFEYYADFGRLFNGQDRSNQSHTLYWVMDVDRAPWVFNFGVGRGFLGDADHWTIKGIFEIPFK
jgi:hypothetical protein